MNEGQAAPVIDLAGENDGYAEFRLGGEGGPSVRVDVVAAELAVNDLARETADAKPEVFYGRLREYMASLGFPDVSTGVMWAFTKRLRGLYEAFEKKVDPEPADCVPRSPGSTGSTPGTGPSAT